MDGRVKPSPAWEPPTTLPGLMFALHELGSVRELIRCWSGAEPAAQGEPAREEQSRREVHLAHGSHLCVACRSRGASYSECYRHETRGPVDEAGATGARVQARRVREALVPLTELCTASGQPAFPLSAAAPGPQWWARGV